MTKKELQERFIEAMDLYSETGFDDHLYALLAEVEGDMEESKND